ncbi:hypothetical protein VNO77_01834 [Canavalia gladiata]|uniref:Uncharacterized protein n=1 Tax=Canavalia gladiata TaxID=3824 RepID=A0AAN9R6N8_CANGL
MAYVTPSIERRTPCRRESLVKACKTFRALKGLIRLQALIRGHLVRRQAVITLCCMYEIVKLQALVGGGRIRQFNIGFEIHEKCNPLKALDGKFGELVGIPTKISKLSINRFICKCTGMFFVLHLSLCPSVINRSCGERITCRLSFGREGMYLKSHIG